MSKSAPQYRPATRCYGMSEARAAIFAGPLARCHRKPAARWRVKGRMMMSNSWFPLMIAAVVSFGPAMAEGKVPLPQETHINEQLIAAAAGDMLRKSCPTIEARTFVVLSKLAELQSYARSKGYTEAEVKVFLKDRTEKARIKALATEYLAKAGVVAKDGGSFCQAGRDEIAKGTLVGSLLRSTQ